MRIQTRSGLRDAGLPRKLTDDPVWAEELRRVYGDVERVDLMVGLYAETYTQTGLDWIDETTMSDVLLRHYPELVPALEGVENAFAPWKRTGTTTA